SEFAASGSRPVCAPRRWPRPTAEKWSALGPSLRSSHLVPQRHRVAWLRLAVGLLAVCLDGQVGPEDRRVPPAILLDRYRLGARAALRADADELERLLDVQLQLLAHGSTG